MICYKFAIEMMAWCCHNNIIATGYYGTIGNYSQDGL